MTAYNSNGFHENIDFLRRNMVDYPWVQWAPYHFKPPRQLQYHIITSTGGYLCGLVDPVTNVFCFKLKHVYDANVAAGAVQGWPSHIAIPGLARPKIDHMAIVREMCAGR